MSIATKVKKIVDSTDGKIFSITFQKRSNGERRTMVCRTGTSVDIKGEGMAYDPSNYNLIPVYDMQKKGYRMIPTDSVVEITVGGKTTKFNKKRT